MGVFVQQGDTKSQFDIYFNPEILQHFGYIHPRIYPYTICLWHYGVSYDPIIEFFKIWTPH